MNQYKLGIASVSFRDYSPKEIINAVKVAGLSCIEWGSDVHAPINNDKKIDEIISLQKEYGIECSSYGTYFTLGKNDISELYDYIAVAKKLGTDTLRLWCGVKNPEKYTNEEKFSLFSECKKAAKIAEEEKVYLCMECHINTYTHTLDGVLELMKETNSPQFLMYWQPVVNESCQKNLEFAKKISCYTKNIHVFHYENGEQNSLFGAIEIWREYLKNFNNIKALLLEFMPDGKLETLKKEAQHLIDIAQ